jgi:hypothetical protein
MVLLLQQAAAAVRHHAKTHPSVSTHPNPRTRRTDCLVVSRILQRHLRSPVHRLSPALPGLAALTDNRFVPHFKTYDTVVLRGGAAPISESTAHHGTMLFQPCLSISFAFRAHDLRMSSSRTF